MVGGWMGSFWISFALLAVASGGPLHRYPRESEDYQNDLSVYANYTANEVCFSEGEVFQKGDVMPNPGPCEECRCEPPSIVCNMIKCPVNNNGCRTIQRANHCCPDYNCECDYNGQLYNDGERLDLPEEPCQVCYCKGGEVMCNSITCYHRDDCDPIQVPGQCCPKYENCPVRDMGSSSSDDKNVLVRSTNKTHHVPPKREMNPWLLTKIPSVSSSSPAKPSQDPTTEGGNIIIVSDWLTERRTTTEDATSDDERRDDFNLDSTDEPDLITDSDNPITILKQDFSSDEAMVVKNLDTITPVDEVIFTRIDVPKQNQEVDLEEPVSVPSAGTQNNLTTDILVSVFNGENAYNQNTTETPFHVTILNEDLRELSSPEKHELLEVGPIEEITNDKSPFKLPGESKGPDTSETPIYNSTYNNISEVSSNVTDLTNTPSNINLSEETKPRDDLIDKTPDNLFGNQTQGKIKDEVAIKGLLTEKEETSTFINEFTGNSLEDQTKDEAKLDKLKATESEVKATSDGYSRTTENSVVSSDVTVSFINEVTLKKDNLEEHHNFSKEVSMEIATELPKPETEYLSNANKSELAISPTIGQMEGYTKDNTLLSEAVTIKTINHSPKPSETKIKRNNINSSDEQGNLIRSTQFSILINNGTAITETTEQTIIPEGITEAQSEIANSTSIKTSEDPPISIVRDNSLPTLIISNYESDDGKELISDAPPVLELNSHVPFLQLGGHGNIDSVMNMFAENHQATMSNVKETEVMDKHSESNSSFKISDNGLVIDQSNATETITSPQIIKYVKNDQLNDRNIKEHNEENDHNAPETTTDVILTTSHIPLTPGDLKALAEYLINDTIKTIQLKNASDYTPNQWLKGNLTSEEKMSSILSAANISIAIMNKTEDKIKKYITESTTRAGEAIRLEKLNSGNSAMNNVKLGNKTSFIQGKSDEYLDTPKINSEPEKPLNDEAKQASITDKTNIPRNTKVSTAQNTTINNNKNEPEKYNINNNTPQNEYYAHSQSFTPQPTNMTGVPPKPTENNLRFDKNSTAVTAETNQYAQNNLLRNDKLPDATPFTSSFSVTTNDPQKQPSP